MRNLRTLGSRAGWSDGSGSKSRGQRGMAFKDRGSRHSHCILARARIRIERENEVIWRFELQREERSSIVHLRAGQ